MQTKFHPTIMEVRALCDGRDLVTFVVRNIATNASMRVCEIFVNKRLAPSGIYERHRGGPFLEPLKRFLMPEFDWARLAEMGAFEPIADTRYCDLIDQVETMIANRPLRTAMNESPAPSCF